MRSVFVACETAQVLLSAGIVAPDMSTDLEADVRMFVAAFSGVRPEDVRGNTTLFGDPGIDGDDAVELFSAFADKYSVDLSNLDIERHFGEEGVCPWLVVAWVSMALRKGTPEEKARRVPIRIRDLVLAAERKQWSGS